ncbi:unnamed protein product [Paramecium pentaurelia]|uniref:Uncharacterized protein n=1 Tax=Paramecium pentaurelia TaxID=43138 RepID=A0A8S1XMQ7_9CILI|nr:unnamed protein product [Paramecium pentaurelia]
MRFNINNIKNSLYTNIYTSKLLNSQRAFFIIIFRQTMEKIEFEFKIAIDITGICWNNEKACSEDLRFFLRSFKIRNHNLEQYLVIRNRTCSDYKKIYQFQLRIQRIEQIYGTKIFFIRFSDFQLREQVFLIVVDQNEQKIRVLEKVKTALIYGINQHQNFNKKFLIKVKTITIQLYLYQIIPSVLFIK